MTRSRTSSTARVAARALAEVAAVQRGTSFVGSGLRLFDKAPSTSQAHSGGEDHISPFDLGRTYELMMAPEARRRSGAHLTPAGVAQGLVGLMGEPRLDDRVLDPAVGGAAFLLAAADRLVTAGAAPEAVLAQLFGVDIDPNAVDVAEAALALWSLDHQVAPQPLPQLVVGDGLLDPLPEVDQVVGNPPFLNQLRRSSSHTADRRRALRDRWGDLVGAYTDDAWLFLAAGIDAVRPGGVVALVQPVSILAARHANAVRSYVDMAGSLRALWVARDKVFDAAVDVCGLVAARDSDESITTASAKRTLVRAVGADFESRPSVRGQIAADGWGSAAAGALGAPQITLTDEAAGCIGDLAQTTAGFRDQFYGFVPHVFEAPGAAPVTELDDVAALVTVGMIDPLSLRWGKRSFKFAGSSFDRPVVDLGALEAANPSLASWTRDRLRPKLVMATQTKVVEVWVDSGGVVIPATPVLSIEPYQDGADVLWKLAAALASPVLSAHFFAAQFGTAMSLNAMKISARAIGSAPLPSDVERWQQAADLLRSGRAGPEDLAEFGGLMCAAYGVDSPGLVQWWTQRMPNRSDG